MSLRLLHRNAIVFNIIKSQKYLQCRRRNYYAITGCRNNGSCCNSKTATSKFNSNFTTNDTKEDTLTLQKVKFSTRISEAPAKENDTIDVLLNKISKQFQLNGSMNALLFDKFLNKLENDSSEVACLTSSDLKFLLGSCSPHYMPDVNVGQRLIFFQRLWKYVEGRKLLNKELIYMKIKVFKENRIALSDHKTFMHNALSEVEELNEDILYNELLEVACSSGMLSQATEIILEMRSKNFPLTERNFNALITCNGRSKNVPGIEKVLENMNAAGLPLSIETKAALVEGYLENNEISKAVKMLDQFKGSFEVKHIINFLRTAVFTPMESSVIIRLVQELPKTLLSGPDIPIMLRNSCVEMLCNKKLDAVKTIIESLPSPIFKENQNKDTFGMFIIHEMVRCNLDPKLVFDMAKLLKESGKNPRALHLATEAVMKKSPPLALPFLDDLSKDEPLRPHYFWPLMMYNFRKNGENGIIRTLKIMSQYDLASDSETFKRYVMPKLSITLEDPRRALKTFNEIGIKISEVFTPIVATLLMQQKVEDVIQLLELYPTKLNVKSLIPPLVSLIAHIRATKQYYQYAKLLANILKRSDNEKTDFAGYLLCEIFGGRSKIQRDIVATKRLITEAQKAGMTISSNSCETMENILKESFPNEKELAVLIKMLREMCNKSLTSLTSIDNSSYASFVNHPRDMSLDDLEFHLIELESKQMNTRGVLRRLLQLCVKENRLQRALEIKEKCEVLKVQHSPGMLASILDLYIKTKDLSKALDSLYKLKETYPAFQIDEHKEIDLCALMVQHKKYEDAIKCLEDRAKKHKITGGEYVMKNIWQLLNNVAHYSATLDPQLPTEENLTRNTFHLLNRLGYCRNNNTVLGPIIREWLLRGNLKAAIEDLRDMSKQYRHTPLQYELMSLLIRLGNTKDEFDSFYGVTSTEAQRLLQEVISIVSNIHGPVNVNSSLLLAFAESGTDSQLRRLLMNPEFRFNEELLIKNCEHLNHEGAISTLLRLAKGCRGLHRVLNEEKVYQMLLETFIRDNNFTAALNLYEHLNADDELKISQEFLRNLINLLKVNKIEIPNTVALRAQVI